MQIHVCKCERNRGNKYIANNIEGILEINNIFTKKQMIKITIFGAKRCVEVGKGFLELNLQV